MRSPLQAIRMTVPPPRHRGDTGNQTSSQVDDYQSRGVSDADLKLMRRIYEHRPEHPLQGRECWQARCVVKAQGRAQTRQRLDEALGRGGAV